MYLAHNKSINVRPDFSASVCSGQRLRDKLRRFRFMEHTDLSHLLKGGKQS